MCVCVCRRPSTPSSHPTYIPIHPFTDKKTHTHVLDEFFKMIGVQAGVVVVVVAMTSFYSDTILTLIN